MNLTHVRLIALASIPATLRSGTGVVYAVFSLIFGLQAANLIVKEIIKQGAEKFTLWIEVGLNFVLAAVTLQGPVGKLSELEKFGGLDGIHAWAEYLLRDQPALLSGVFVLQAILIPVFVSGGAFNQLAGDLQHGAVRYQLLSTSRASLFVGRFCGMALFTTALITVLTSVLVAFVGFQLELYAWGELIQWGLRCTLALVIISLPYVAFCAWISGAVNSPFGALVFTGLVIPAQPFLAIGAMNAWEPLGKLIYLMPWGIQFWLFHPDPAKVILAAIGCLAYTAAFLAIGLYFFRKRDL